MFGWVLPRYWLPRHEWPEESDRIQREKNHPTITTRNSCLLLTLAHYYKIEDFATFFQNKQQF